MVATILKGPKYFLASFWLDLIWTVVCLYGWSLSQIQSRTLKVLYVLCLSACVFILTCALCSCNFTLLIISFLLCKLLSTVAIEDSPGRYGKCVGGSWLYMIASGVNWVAVRKWVLYHHSAKGIHLLHSFGSSPHIHLKYIFKHLLTTSVCPSL